MGYFYVDTLSVAFVSAYSGSDDDEGVCADKVSDAAGGDVALGLGVDVEFES
jgi:hypothetical protein